jgi:hypothetical protein
MPAIDDAADTFTFRCSQLLDHDIKILHEREVVVRGRGRRRRGQTGSGVRLGPVLSKSPQEIWREGHVFVEERATATEFVGRVILEDRSDYGTGGEGLGGRRYNLRQ